MTVDEVEHIKVDRRWRWLAVLGVVVLTIGVVGAFRHRSHNSAWVEVASGTYAGTPWRLDVREQDGHLCMEVDGPGGPADTAHTMAGACVFADEPTRGTYYYAGGPGPGTSMVGFGPLPEQATRIRVASHQILNTQPLPSRSGLPRGRFWIQFTAYNWPTAAEGTALQTAQPLDDAGNVVAFRKF